MAVFADTGLGGPHFDPAEFDEAIRTHGHRAQVRPRRACPCADAVTGQPSVNCPSCDNGSLWGVGAEEWVLIPGRRRGDVYDPIGLYLNGMVIFSFKSTRTPGHLDRIELLDAEMVVNQERHVVDDGKERVRVRPVLRVEAIDAWDGAQAVEVAPASIEVDVTGQITWIDSLPAAHTPYTLRYVTTPAYVLLSPQSRDEGGSKMPYRAIAQRLDFFQSKGR